METLNITQEDYSLIAIALVIGVLVGAILFYALVRKLWMNNADKKLRQREDQFTGLASHYMLTPISIIQMAINTLIEGDDQLSVTERRKMYDMVLKGQRRLWILAEQLILVGDIDQSTLKIANNIISLSAVAMKAVSSVDVFAREKGLKIRFVDELKDENSMRGDERRLEQAIVALLDNAIKFSVEKSEIVVAVSEQEGQLVLWVRDRGVGMPSEVIDHLSNKYFRGSKLYDFDYGGMGLGLYIARAIFSAHDGSISVESKPKKGTLFKVAFPKG